MRKISEPPVEWVVNPIHNDCENSENCNNNLDILNPICEDSSNCNNNHDALNFEYPDTSENSRNNPYVSSKFIAPEGDNNDGWDKSPHNNNLRGGAEDSGNGRGDSSADYMRQGPCPAGYHVPSQKELDNLLVMFYNLNNKGGTLNGDDNGHSVVNNSDNFSNKFFENLRLPFAGGRFNDGKVSGLGEDLLIWSSSAQNLINPFSRLLFYHEESYDTCNPMAECFGNSVITNYTISTNNDIPGYRSLGLPVRCFKDSTNNTKNILVLEYDTDGGSAIQSQTIPEGENAYLPGYTTHKTGANFIGRFNEDMTKEYTIGSNGSTFNNLLLSSDMADENGIVKVYAKRGNKVTFLDWDGSIINIQAVADNESAITPSNPTRDGYIFDGWDTDFSNILADTIVTAKYKKSSSYSGGGSSSSSSKNTSSDKNKESESETKSPGNENTNEQNENNKNLENDNNLSNENSKENSSISQNISNNSEKYGIHQGGNNASKENSEFSQELKEAYNYAKQNGITSKDSIQAAKMYGNLTRIQMAKMLSNYAINVLGMNPDKSKINKFNDVTEKMDLEYDNAVTVSYQLGIMGQNMPKNNFRPNDEVPRSEFVAAFSRMLYGTTDGEFVSTKDFYIPHMAKLYNEGIINMTDPKIKEKRGYVMLMLMRSKQ